MKKTALSIVIVNYNSPQLITKCLCSIKKYVTGLTKEVIVVDNNSQEEDLDALDKKYNFLKIIRLPKNMGFGYANNSGVKNAQGEIILLLNSDIEIIDFSINKALKDFLKNRKNILWGFKLLWPDGRFQNSFSREITFLDFIFSYTSLFYLSKYIKRINYHKYYDQSIDKLIKVSVVYGAAMLFWRKHFLSLNGFNNKYFMYFEDIDFCDRFRNELKGEIYYYPFTSMIHSVKGGLDIKRIIDYQYLRSKYIYGLNKFKIFTMVFFIPLDIILIGFFIIFRELFKKKVT